MVKPLLHRRESIIHTTIDVMDEFGIQGVSTREVARREGISEGAIFKHFPKKCDLILGVLDHYAQYDEDIILSTKAKSDCIMERIQYFFNLYAEYYQNYPQMITILQSYEGLIYDHVLEERIQSIMIFRRSFIYQLLIEAIHEKQISRSNDVNNLTDIFFGTFRYKCLMWRYKKFGFSLKDEVLSAVNMIIKLINKEE